MERLVIAQFILSTFLRCAFGKTCFLRSQQYHIGRQNNMLKTSISKDCLLFFLAAAAFKTFDDADARKLEEQTERNPNAAGGFDLTMKLIEQFLWLNTLFQSKTVRTKKRQTLYICED